MNAQVHIDTAREAVRFDRMIFGQFLEHFHREVYGGVFDPGSPLSDERGFRKDVIDALRELRVPVVRWPGGCFASAYHWKDGVGPDRRPAYDKAWRVEDPNTFGTDEFVAWCRAIGAEPFICTNAGSGTEEEISDWVEYCNRDIGRWGRLRRANGCETPHAVKYWSIGNENYGGWEMGAKRAADWPHVVNEAAKMMKAADPSIELFAAALPDVDWTLPLLRQAGHWLAYVSIHGYWDTLWQENNPSGYAACMVRSTEPEAAIRATRDLIRVAGLEGKVAIAFDEWNLRGWHHPPGADPAAIAARDANDINATYTMADAVFSACFLNSCLRHADAVRMACMSPVVNCRGPLYAHADGIVKRTTFHVLKMYADRLAPNVIDCRRRSDPFAAGKGNVPALDAVATADDDRERIVLALVNRHAEDEIVCRVRVDGRAVPGTAAACVLAGDSPDAFNDVEAPERVVPEETSLRVRDGAIALPPHSVTICEFRNCKETT